MGAGIHDGKIEASQPQIAQPINERGINMRAPTIMHAITAPIIVSFLLRFSCFLSVSDFVIDSIDE